MVEEDEEGPAYCARVSLEARIGGAKESTSSRRWSGTT